MGNLFLVPSRHARDTARIRGARVTHQAKHEASKAGATTILRTEAQGNRGGSQPTAPRPIHQGDEESHLDSQPGAGAKESHRRTTNVCRLRASQQALRKGPLPLPRIDQIIDSTAGCDLLSFLDAYSGYNQIRMRQEEDEHTSFITPYSVFCYNTMPFGLKNAGATYQRMMQAYLKEQIGRNVQVYVDDIIIKTYKADTLLDDLCETFAALNKYRIKLNPKKCAFGVPAGEVLCYFVSARGKEEKPQKGQTNPPKQKTNHNK